MLEHDVPDVKTSVHLGRVENGWTNRVPASVSQIGHVVPKQSYHSQLHCLKNAPTLIGLIQPQHTATKFGNFFLVEDMFRSFNSDCNHCFQMLAITVMSVINDKRQTSYITGLEFGDEL